MRYIKYKNIRPGDIIMNLRSGHNLTTHSVYRVRGKVAGVVFLDVYMGIWYQVNDGRTFDPNCWVRVPKLLVPVAK